jgi:hypothetical protein
MGPLRVKLLMLCTQNLEMTLMCDFMIHHSNLNVCFHSKPWDRRGPDRIVVGFITTYVIGTYHH